MKKLSLFLIALIAMASCESQIENSTVTEPTVVTKSVKEITESTAMVIGQVVADGGADVTERGVCWNTDGAPIIIDYCVKDAEVGLGTFTSNLTDLEANTTYYVRAYATNEVGTTYGEEISFTTETPENPTPDDPTPDDPTPDPEPETPQHEWVDLGLSVKWATCNVGASSPEEYGNYYAWGETEPKDYYSTDITMRGLSISELKSRGYIDSEDNLTSSYDAATANWGEEWRMPTESEIQELVEDGIWNWQYFNGVKGYKVTGPSGNSIFLPPAGYRGFGWSENVGEFGYYWGATASEAWGDYTAERLIFSEGTYWSGSDLRHYAKTVRPVLK